MDSREVVRLRGCPEPLANVLRFVRIIILKYYICMGRAISSKVPAGDRLRVRVIPSPMVVGLLAQTDNYIPEKKLWKIISRERRTKKEVKSDE